MNGEHGLPPLGMKGFVAIRTNIFLRCNILTSGEQRDRGKDDYGNSDHPPGDIVMSIVPIHSAGG